MTELEPSQKDRFGLVLPSLSLGGLEGGKAKRAAANHELILLKANCRRTFMEENPSLHEI